MADMPRPSLISAKPPPDVAHMDADAGMGRTDRHVDYANLVFHLADHDTCLAGMDRHPMENSRRRAHGISAIEFHACSRSSHGHRGVAAEHGIAVSVIGSGQANGLKFAVAYS